MTSLESWIFLVERGVLHKIPGLDSEVLQISVGTCSLSAQQIVNVGKDAGGEVTVVVRETCSSLVMALVSSSTALTLG